MPPTTSEGMRYHLRFQRAWPKWRTIEVHKKVNKRLASTSQSFDSEENKESESSLQPEWYR